MNTRTSLTKGGDIEMRITERGKMTNKLVKWPKKQNFPCLNKHEKINTMPMTCIECAVIHTTNFYIDVCLAAHNAMVERMADEEKLKNLIMSYWTAQHDSSYCLNLAHAIAEYIKSQEGRKRKWK